jgi:hypothetical protein
LGTLLAVVAGYAALLAHPEILFRHRLVHEASVIHARAPVPSAVRVALDSAAGRLRRSALGQTSVARVFVTGTPGWYAFFTGPGRRAMAKNYELGNSIYLPMIEATALEVVHFDGRRGPLASILAHEAAHTELQRAVGGVRSLWRLPFWKKEGYPELVAYGDSIRLDDMIAALRAHGATITWPRSHPVPRRYFEAETVWRYLVHDRQMSVTQVVATTEPLPSILNEMTTAARPIDTPPGDQRPRN